MEIVSYFSVCILTYTLAHRCVLWSCRPDYWKKVVMTSCWSHWSQRLLPSTAKSWSAGNHWLIFQIALIDCRRFYWRETMDWDWERWGLIAEGWNLHQWKVHLHHLWVSIVHSPPNHQRLRYHCRDYMRSTCLLPGCDTWSWTVEVVLWI